MSAAIANPGTLTFDTCPKCDARLYGHNGPVHGSTDVAPRRWWTCQACGSRWTATWRTDNHLTYVYDFSPIPQEVRDAFKPYFVDDDWWGGIREFEDMPLREALDALEDAGITRESDRCHPRYYLNDHVLNLLQDTSDVSLDGYIVSPRRLDERIDWRAVRLPETADTVEFIDQRERHGYRVHDLSDGRVFVGWN